MPLASTFGPQFNKETCTPLLRIDLYEGRTDAELEVLLDAVHRATLAAFKVPERDRYQMVHEHRPASMIIEDDPPWAAD